MICGNFLRGFPFEVRDISVSSLRLNAVWMLLFGVSCASVHSALCRYEMEKSSRL